jgi:hypothetical protein
MKSLWKSLWMVCALAGALTVAAGCGPQQAYCPNTGNAQGVCPIQGDDAQVKGVDAQTQQCPTGYQFLPNDADVFSCMLVN